MTATQTISNTTTQAHLVGDRVRVQRGGGTYPGRISSIHHRDNGVEYVVHTDATDGGMGHIVNIWTTSGHSAFLTPAPAGGEAR
jgi:hypothetical protein